VTEASPTLESRYGRTPQDRRRNRLFGFGAGGAIILAALVWVIWVAFDGTAPTMEVRDIAHSSTDRESSVTYELSLAPGTEASCAVQALDERHGIVGWKVVEVPASEQYTRVLQETVRTTAPANTALIYKCWLP